MARIRLRAVWDRIAERLNTPYSFVKEVVQEYGRDRGHLFAASISFFGLISIVPLLLVAIGVFGFILGDDQAFREVMNFAREYIPVGLDALEENLRELRDQSGLLSGIGLLGLIWTGSQVFVILQQVMNAALGAEQRIGFVRARVMAIITMIVAGIFFGLSIGATSLITAIRGFEAQIAGIGPDDLDPIWDTLGWLLPVIGSVLAFTFIYKVLPLKDIGWKAPVAAGIVAGVLFEIAKHAFAWYVADIADFTRVYGSLGGVIILVLWIYYVSMIAVLGAEVASVYTRWQEKGEGGGTRNA